MLNHVKPEQPFRNNKIQKVTVSRKYSSVGFFPLFVCFFHFKANKTGWELGPPQARFYCTLSQIRIWNKTGTTNLTTISTFTYKCSLFNNNTNQTEEMSRSVESDFRLMDSAQSTYRAPGFTLNLFCFILSFWHPELLASIILVIASFNTKWSLCHVDSIFSISIYLRF